MPKQCECPHHRWELPSLVVNLLRLAFAIWAWAWAVMYGAAPTVVVMLHLTANLMHLAVTMLMVLLGVLL